MADSILRLKVESQEYDNKLKQAAQGLTRYADECRKVGGTLEVVEKETLDYVRALGQMDTTSRTATGKLAEMKKTFTELSVVYKNMTDEEKNSPFGKALATSLDQLKGRIGESKVQLDDINKSINGGGGLTGALDAVAGKFGLSIDQVTKFGGVVGVATTAVQVAKDAFFQSEGNIDEWGRTVEGAKGAYNVFLDTLNNGNWSNFFRNLSKAIQGGRDLYDVFDRLGSIKSNNAAAIAITQKEIAELRLAKQQGENVDAKLKSATERLAALQKQGVSAGMAAGRQSAFQTIRNGVNSVGGASINDATIKYAVDRIMKNGQSEFDKYARNRDILRERGMVTKTQTIYDSQGGTYERQYREFDINALTKEQQKQYALAQAITEGETRIQAGISAYAQAVSEGTASAREAFKGNRYALQGSTGGGGRIKKQPETIDFESSVLAQAQMASAKFGAMGMSKMLEPKEGPSQAWEAYTSSMASAFEEPLSPLQQLNKELAEMKANLENAPDTQSYQQGLSLIAEKEKEIAKFKGETKTEDIAKDTEDAWKGAASAMASVGSAMASIEDPAAKTVGLVMQAIATVANAFAQALSDDKTTTGNIWAFIAAAVASTASMVGMIASIHSATGYAQGGIVDGRSYSGDNIPILANAGEVVLTRAMASNLASQLEGNGLSNLNLTASVSAEQIRFVLNTNGRRTGRGEFVQTNSK